MTNFIPIFPLALVVYPGEKLNLHIFEPRYKLLIAECFHAKKSFGIPVVLNNKLADKGTLMEITEISKVYDDGKMDIIMIRPFPKLLFPFIVYRLFAGTLHRSKYVRYLKTDKQIKINTDEERFHIDGEPVTISGDVIISVRKNALKVLKTRYNRL